MSNINLKLNFTSTLGLIFLAIIFISIFMKDMIFNLILTNTGENQIEESRKATAVTADLLLSLDNISLDTSVLNSPYLQALTPLPTFPIDSQTISNFGKANPFLGNFIIVSSKATTTVGAVIYSNQREVNSGRSIVPVSATRR